MAIMKKSFGSFEKLEPEADFPFEIIDTGEKALEAIKILGKEPYFAFDIETTGLNPRDQEAEVISVAFASPNYLGGLMLSGSGSFSGELNQRILSEILNSPPSKIAHNGKFDVIYLEEAAMILTSNFKYDTLLGFYLLDEDPRRKRSLKYLGREFTSYPVIEFPDDGVLKGKSAEEILRYNCSDTRLTLALYEIIQGELKKLEMIPLWELITFASISLARMENVGVEIDEDKLFDMETETRNEEEELRKALMKTARNKGYPDLKLKSPLALRKFLFDVLGLTPSELTPKGQPSTKEAVLEKLDHPFPKGLLLWRKKTKLLDTYFSNLSAQVEEDGRVHPDYRIWGTRSGRSSCSNPNVQNIPRDGEIRSLFVPKKGWFFVEGDYSQFELRVMALYSKDENLMNAFLSGQDPHREIAAFLFRKDLVDVTDEERRKAKTLNYAILYGMGKISLAEDLEIEPDEAGSLIERYYTRFSKVNKWVQNQHRRVMIDKEVTSLTKRKRRFPELSQGSVNAVVRAEILKQSVNTIIQGTASDFALLGMTSVDDKLKEMEARSIMFIHDSIVVESPKAEVSRVIEILKKEMVSFGRDLPIPFEVDIKVGLDWKNMEKI